jgi:hypothetical protein
LNDIEKNTIFTHNPANAKGVSNYDIVDKSYLSSSTHHRKVVRISLLRMTCVTFHKVPFKDSFQVENGKVIHVAETFTITKKTALLVDDEKVYPPFCYKNYAEYAVMKAAQPIGTYPAEMLTFLKEDGVKEADVEKYYRTIDTDKPLFFYKANGK